MMDPERARDFFGYFMPRTQLIAFLFLVSDLLLILGFGLLDKAGIPPLMELEQTGVIQGIFVVFGMTGLGASFVVHKVILRQIHSQAVKLEAVQAGYFRAMMIAMAAAESAGVAGFICGLLTGSFPILLVMSILSMIGKGVFFPSTGKWLITVTPFIEEGRVTGTGWTETLFKDGR